MTIGYLGEQEITSERLALTGTEHFAMNELVRTALLTTQAGYKQENQIKVVGEAYSDYAKLNRFLSYVLNK